MNDVKRFFDCIVHTVAILVLLSFGMPTALTRAIFKMLQKVEHHINTGYGALNIAYYDKVILSQGTGQGNGNSPKLWG